MSDGLGYSNHPRPLPPVPPPYASADDDLIPFINAQELPSSTLVHGHHLNTRDFEIRFRRLLSECGVRSAQKQTETLNILSPVVLAVIAAARAHHPTEMVARRPGSLPDGGGIAQVDAESHPPTSARRELTYRAEPRPTTPERRLSSKCSDGRRFALPVLPEGLAWPVEQYAGSAECSLASAGGPMRRGIVAYLDRVWMPLARAGVSLSLPIIRHFDKSAAKAVDKYTEKNPKTGYRRQLPFCIPKEKEVNDEIIIHSGSIDAATKQRPALVQTIRSRRRRGMPIPMPAQPG
jgi:hypothetical protein